MKYYNNKESGKKGKKVELTLNSEGEETYPIGTSL